MIASLSRRACLAALFVLMCAVNAPADVVTRPMPELIGTIVQGDAPFETVVDFGVDFSPLHSLTIEIVATGIPGEDANGPVPATPIVTAREIIDDVVADPWLDGEPFGAYGPLPTPDWETYIPQIIDDLVISGIQQVTVEAPPIGPGLITPAQITIVDATITADFNPIQRGCGGGDLDCDGFVGISDLNIILSNWNQQVTPGDSIAGDPSGDGFVGIGDLNFVLGNWNAGTPPTDGEDPIGCFNDECFPGFIGIAELNKVLGEWNELVPPADPSADWNSDGYIGIHDLNYILFNWNAGTPPGAVPEPGALSCMGLAGLLLCRRR